jgi:hypothetical protein
MARVLDQLLGVEQVLVVVSIPEAVFVVGLVVRIVPHLEGMKGHSAIRPVARWDLGRLQHRSLRSCFGEVGSFLVGVVRLFQLVPVVAGRNLQGLEQPMK